MDRIQSRGTPLTPDGESRRTRDLARANRDFQTMFLTEFLKPLTSSLAGSEDEGAMFASSGLDTYGVFVNQALAGELSGSWPLPDISGSLARAMGNDAAAPPGSNLGPIALPRDRAFTLTQRPAATAPEIRSAAAADASAAESVSTSKANLTGVPDLPDEELERASRLFDLPVNLLRAVVLTESGGRASATSSKGATGYMQLMPATAKEMGATDPKDPWENIWAGAKYLSRQLTRFGRVDHALAAYNAGPGNVARHDGIPPFPETQAYVKKVLAWKSRLDSLDPSRA
ncbi:MAG: lytic transglycosylase domain-containing protein [Candidatus Eisenbacteria bacterium]